MLLYEHDEIDLMVIDEIVVFDRLQLIDDDVDDLDILIIDFDAHDEVDDDDIRLIVVSIHDEVVVDDNEINDEIELVIDDHDDDEVLEVLDVIEFLVEKDEIDERENNHQ